MTAPAMPPTTGTSASGMLAGNLLLALSRAGLQDERPDRR